MSDDTKDDKPAAEVKTGELTTDEYYWFCSKYADNCFDLRHFKEAVYYLRKAISISEKKKDYDELAYSVSRLMVIMNIEKRYSESIAIGEKYENICSGSDWVYEIKTGLCFAYSARGWNRKAQSLANIVIEHKKKDSDAYYHSLTCGLYKRSYNSGKCKNRIGVLSEWYDIECHVNGSNSVAAMEVLAEKARVLANE